MWPFRASHVGEVVRTEPGDAREVVKPCQGTSGLTMFRSLDVILRAIYNRLWNSRTL